MARHNLQSVGLRIVFEFCQTLTLLDTSVISDILLGMPSIDYKIYLVARFHLRRLYKVLKKVNYYATNTYTIKLLHTHDVFGIRQHFVANRMHASVMRAMVLSSDLCLRARMCQEGSLALS